MKVGDWIERLDAPTMRGIIVPGGAGDDLCVLVSGESVPRIIWADDLDRWWEPLHIDPVAVMPPFWVKEQATFVPREKQRCSALVVGVRPGWVAYWVNGGPTTRQQVETIEDLSRLSAPTQPDGTEVEVKSIQEVWQLVKASTAPLDQYVVMPSAGSGRWVRTASTRVTANPRARTPPAQPKPMFFITPWVGFHSAWTPEKPPTAWARLLDDDHA